MECQAYRTRETVRKCRNFQRNFRVQRDAFPRCKRQRDFAMPGATTRVCFNVSKLPT